MEDLPALCTASWMRNLFWMVVERKALAELMEELSALDKYAEVAADLAAARAAA